MSTFSAMDIGRSGAGFAHAWLDTLAHNMANVNTVRPAGEEPFRAHRLVAAPVDDDRIAATGAGVRVRNVIADDAEPGRRYDPDSPLADEDGLVTLPVVDLTAQMTDLMLANRTYQANLRTVSAAREAYEAALRIGQR